MQEKLMQNAENNLKNNEYPGRGIIIGSNASGSKLIQVYWIMEEARTAGTEYLLSRGSHPIKHATI